MPVRPFFIQLIFVIILFFNLVKGQQSKTLNLMPVPKAFELTGDKLYIDRNFKIDILSYNGDDLYKYATRVLRRLDKRTGLLFYQDVLRIDEEVQKPTLTIETNRRGRLLLGEDESYRLAVTKDGIAIKAETDIGAMRGLETFIQLLDADEEGYFFPTVEITDDPRFPWRGLMIDVSRHFHDVGVIKRNLDAMAAVKLNVLHLHLSDDQGFRVESKTFPKLHLEASDGEYFTHNQIREIIEYARARGIRVVPEFDVPAHTTAFIVAYPELGSSDEEITLERGWGVKDPVLNPAKPFTYKFLDELFAEMTALFPDPYFHIGGDENNGVHWAANEEIQQFKQDNNIEDKHELQTYFNKRVLNILTKYNKKMIGWDEILQPDLPKESVIQSWRGQKYLMEAAKKGYQTILSKGYYIDLVKPTKDHYLIDPVPADSDLTDEQKQNILGGEATMWSEFTDSDVIDSRIWPRTAAIAERFWSPAEVKDVEDMHRRLEYISFRLEEHGLTHIKNYEMFLRRLTNNQQTEPLRTLVDVVEMLKIYKRHQHFDGKYQSHTPLSRVVDASRPDQKIPREFAKLIDQYIESGYDQEYEQAIRGQLLHWKKNEPQLEALAGKSPVLNEILPMSKKLTTVSEIGIQTLEYIKSQKKPSIFWKKNVLKSLENAKEQVAGTELMVVAPVEKLVLEITK